MATSLQSADSLRAANGGDAELDELLHTAGVASLEDAGWIRVTGSDRVRWLNGMVTNAIQQLAPGEGCYNFVLNAQGRIQGDLTAWLESDAILLETGRDQLPALLAHFDRFIIMDDVELADTTAGRSGILLAGPQAASILGKVGLVAAPQTMRLLRESWDGAPIAIICAHSPLVSRFELWSDAATIQQLAASFIHAGAARVSSDAVEQLRILEGTPRYGVDIRNSETSRDLPQETAQTRALHFSKGCYLGQEIVERIRSRGNVHRTFSGFELQGTLPRPGTTITEEGKPVGELTSVARMPASKSNVQIALGYVRREALDRRVSLEYSGGSATAIAMPHAIS